MLHWFARLSMPLALALLLPLPARAQPPKVVAAFNTYESAPFLVGYDSGLAPDLVRHLNRMLAGRLELKLTSLPRQRLLKLHLERPESFEGVALLLAPQFVGDAGMQTYQWSEPLFIDYNVVIATADRMLTAMTLDWAAGKRMATVRGQRYVVFDPLLANGRVMRIETNDERTALTLVAVGRADFAQMNHLMFEHLARDLKVGGSLAGLPEPGAPHFQRRLLIGRGAPELVKPLNEAIAALHCDPDWRQVAAHYGFAPLACRSAPPAPVNPPPKPAR